jgi:hypothetical protein
MECPGGAFEWSNTHNSPFELSKLKLINFPCPFTRDNDENCTITLIKPNPNAPLTTQTIQPSTSHRYLGIILDPKLKWNHHFNKVIANATRWTNQFSRLGKIATGIPPHKLRRLYLSVAIPKITYAADIWFKPVSPSEWNPRCHTGSIGIARKLNSIQRCALITITGALKSTASDVLEVYTNILPMHLTLNRACCRAAVRLATLPTSHPLSKPVARAANR